MKQNAIPRNTKFEVVLRLISDKDLKIEQLESLFILTTIFGGFGKRARRGMGSMIITKIKKDDNHAVIFAMPTNLDSILQKLNTLNLNFEKSRDRKRFECIVPKTTKNEPYPHINQIHLGRPQSGLELKISKATHETSQEAGRDYGNAMGKVMGGRFSSPVYTSITQNQQKQTLPVIVTLNTVPDARNSRYDLNVQEDFKSKIL
jgi:CRISPR-associated protein Cmr1